MNTLRDYQQVTATRAAEQPYIYTDLHTGSAVREHPELLRTGYTGPERLAWGMYIDDVEVVNPIGMARGKHKLVLIYVQCLNPPPHVRNRLHILRWPAQSLRM